MGKNYREWSYSNVVNFYTKHRNKIEDLYESEKFFLPGILFPGVKVLDIGCAAGGFYNIMCNLQSKIEYVGIDISPLLIKKARDKYPEVKFLTANAISLPFKKGEFNIVFSSGVFHMEPDYMKAIEEAYRVTNKFLLFDLRLTRYKGGFFYQKLVFERESNGPKAPYIVCNIDKIVSFLENLNPKPLEIQVKGYYRKPSSTAFVKYKKIYMAIFLIRKGHAGNYKTSFHFHFNLNKK